MSTYSKEWKDIFEIISKYWKEYGGWRTFIKSPYLHIAIILTLVTIQFWLNNKWWEQTLSVLPSILGFTLSGFAIFLGYGTEKFRKLMAFRSPATGKSPYLDVVVAFVHFSLFQILAIFLSLIASNISAFSYFDIQAQYKHIGSIYLWLVIGFLGYGVFIYSLVLSFSVSFTLYRLATWYVLFETKEYEKEHKNKTGK